ncbi:MAG: UDP-N-acetylmuramoyl-L-alanine--D-glutamate ligase [Cryomorphaceae bacterium]|nr:UDP-N-acetylmuramoyl-L-alanine--D-glutamate ligase [Flavobacteriales bacterium]
MKLLVLGAGESGAGAAILGKKQGFEVFVSDLARIKEKYKNVLTKAEIEWEEETHAKALEAEFDLIVKSPGIPGNSGAVLKLREKGAELISEIEFASRYTDATIIGITGTNGKTTTATLVHYILNKAGLDVALAGNVGKSFAWSLAERDRDYFVLEISSFQLDDISSFRPHIALLLNITPDHLDRYENRMDLYIAAKFKIGAFQEKSDHLVYCADDENIVNALRKAEIRSALHPISIYKPVVNGAFTDNKTLKINLTTKPFNMSIHELALQGKHNAYNSMAAGVAARILEIRKDVVRESLSDFQNVEHRLEFVAQIHGINFINDSKATNVNSTWYALESLSEPVVWIVGGVDKGNDYSILEPLIKEKVKAIICLGKDNTKLLEYFSPMVENIVEAGSADEAVAFGYRFAKKGETVLLSPACASFDLFENYEDRGQQFKRAIRAL